MFSIVKSGTVCGIRSLLVAVETDISNGLPGFELVGLAGSEVREARERVRVSLKNEGIFLPPKRITVNLAPADLRKEGSGLDLAIAAGILVSAGCVEAGSAEGLLFLGELGLGGEVKPVRGVLPVVLAANEWGIHTCLVPQENTGEGAAAAGKGMRVAGISSLGQLITYLSLPQGARDAFLPPWTKEDTVSAAKPDKTRTKQEAVPDFAEVAGQEQAKRAAEIAAAGFHHFLMMGPPGAGKTMIARRIPSILPGLSELERLEVSAVYSVAGLLKESGGLAEHRPFQKPHHSLSRQALVGGGRIPKPGQISLAHRGVLFLDELAEFRRETLDALRQPLETREISIARLQGAYTYPADFMLVAAMNPCPCGYYPDRGRCRCTEREVQRYLHHVSGPILDRMDLCVQVQEPDFRELASGRRGENSRTIRARVMEACERQRRRYRNAGFRFNSEVTDAAAGQYLKLEMPEQAYLEKIFHKMKLSARGYYRILKTARTIADLAGAERILTEHLREAFTLRTYENRPAE